MKDSTETSGACVLVRGEVVAWFKDFDDAAQEWCTENHFGEWLVWGATPPQPIPLTPEEYETALVQGAALAALFKED